MQPEQQQRIMGYFIEESKEHLNTIEQGLLNLQRTIEDPEAVSEVFRAAHSVKGGAAMLGLSSIQKTAYRLEDYFKVLKETRGIHADQKLETLLNKVFAGLQTLLGHLQTPTGLSDELANPVMADIEPAFAEVEQHLERLVQQVTVVPDQKTPEQSDSALVLIFQNEVPEQLREMLQWFRQAATQPQVRTELQEICLGLQGLGDAFALESWSRLLGVAHQAIANPANDLQLLAPIVIKEIKQAQELVLAGQSQKILPSEQLQAMVPAEVAAESSLDLDADLAEFFAIADGATATDDFDLSAFEAETSLQPTATTASEADRLDLDALFDLPEIETTLVEGSVPEMPDQGSEMGLAELNSLADLFEGELPDLGSSWQKEQIIDPTTVTHAENPGELSSADLDLDLHAEETGDFSDLLFTTDISPSETDDLDSLFGDSLLEETPSTDAQGTDLTTGVDEFGLPELDEAGSSELDDLFTSDLSEQPQTLDSRDFDLDTFGDLDTALTSSTGTDSFTAEFEDPSIAEFEEEEANTSLNHLGELFAGLEDSDLEFSQSTEAAQTPTTADSASLNGRTSTDAAADLSSMFDSIETGEPPQEQTFDLSDMDDLLNESSPQQADSTLDLEADLDELFTETPPAQPSDDQALDDLLTFESDALEADSLGNDHLDLDLNFDLNPTLESPESENSDITADFDLEGDLLSEDLSLEAVSETALEVDTTDADLDALFDEATTDDASDLQADPGWSAAEADLADLFGDESAVDLPLETAEPLSAGDSEVTSDLTDFLDLELPETATVTPNLENHAADLDPLFDTGASGVEAESLNEFLTSEPDASLNLDDLGFDEIDSNTASTYSLDSAIDDLDALSFEMPEATPDSAADLNNLGLDPLDFALPEEEIISSGTDAEASLDTLDFPDLTETHDDFNLDFLGTDGSDQPDVEQVTLDSAADLNDLGLDPLDFALPGAASGAISDTETNLDALAFADLTDANDDLNLDLLGIDAPADTLNLEETQSFNDLDLNFEDLAPAQDDPNALDGLDALLDSEQFPTEERQDGDFDPLLGLGIAASAAGLGGAIAAHQSNSGLEDSLSDLDDLDQLLGSSALDSNSLLAGATAADAEPNPLDDLDGLLDQTLTGTESEQFADLESLLATAPDSSVAQTNQVTSPGSDTEFGDLEKMLEDTEQTMGGSPTVKNRGTVAPGRRSTRSSKGFSEQTMRVPVKHLDNLSNLVGELVVNRNSLEQDQERMRQSLDNLLYQVQQLSDVGQRMQDLYERSLLESSLLASRQNYRVPFGAVESNGNGHTTGVEYDPLEMDRFTGFHSLSQEMIELIVRVRESASDIEFIVDETDQVTRMFRQVTTQLQEGLTRSRMVPFAQAADRLPRAVRDIALKCGKQAELVIEGRETLIDKMILEHLYDPLTHLVNNAITHGIEDPTVRQAGGKAPVGRITIRAFHQGNQTIISVGDDGAGVDVDRVRKKALEKGLISPAEAQTMSRLDIYDLLFHPGFSTKDEADDFAGRGVGMDVVRTSLSEIRGTVSTDSVQNKGTTFTIRLPLTLSISKALCCISDRARIAFPMDGVEDMLDIPKERIQTNAEGQPCIAWRDSVLPLRPLKDLLSYNRHLSRGNVYGGSQEDDMVSVVVLRSAGNYLALQVDQVLGEQEIVIKQLESPVPKPIGIAGATVLGDGRIMPIADVLELIDLSMGRIRREIGTMWDQGTAQTAFDTITAKTDPTVLIVDDSITVRELLSMTFNKVGYRVEQARDGQEAWEKLRSGLPCDIVFCDIEMPRMDGLELLSRIQKDPNLNHLPIAMLTSRGADRHRQMAASLGASGYFTKPYLEEALLDAAQRMLKGEVLISSNG